MNEYFTEQRIINQLCNERIKLSEQRDNKQYLPRLVGSHNSVRRRNELDDMLPSRRQWNAFRPRRRPEGGNPNLAALRHAVSVLRERHPEYAWVQRLNSFIADVQARVLATIPFSFASPRIGWLPKPDKKNEYRALCVFALQDNVIASLFAQFIRDAFDQSFSNSSMAFRARNALGQTPTHHDAFNALYQLKHSQPERDLYVAEADVSGFFDTVDQAIALTAFDEAAQRRPVAVRAREIFRAYLNCYNFPESVLTETEPRLKRVRGPEAHFSKPKTTFNDSSRVVGVPQGGAVSGIIANLVLDFADKMVERERDRLGTEIHYYRYCDDMILLSPKKEHCQAVFEVYLAALDQLRLPYHKTERIIIYRKNHWKHKSKAVYCWSGRKWFCCVPWVQFVGYQIRYDGLVRVRKGAYKSQAAKFAEFTSKAKHFLLNAGRVRPIAATRTRAMNSLAGKLMAKGVGWTDPYSQGPRPMCWSGGFKALDQKPLVTTVLQHLDSLRQKHIIRFADARINYRAGSGRWNDGGLKNPKNSYSAQYRDAGGRELINNPWQPETMRDRIKCWVFLACKKALESHQCISKLLKRVRRRWNHLSMPKVRIQIGEVWNDRKFRRDHIYEVLKVGWWVQCRNIQTNQIRYIPHALFSQGRLTRSTDSSGRFI